jgi:hypothetical protein
VVLPKWLFSSAFKNEYIFHILQMCYMTCQTCHTVSSRCLLQIYEKYFVSFCLKMTLSVWYLRFKVKGSVMRKESRTHVDWPQSRAATRPARWLSSSLLLWTSWCVLALWLLGALRRLYRLHNVTKIDDFLAQDSETLKVRNLQSSSTSSECFILLVYVTKLLVCAITHAYIIVCQLTLWHQLTRSKCVMLRLSHLFYYLRYLEPELTGAVRKCAIN